VSGATPVARRTGGALAVGAGILLSRLAGLVRQRVIAHFLGVGDANDVLSAAFRIPNVVQNLLGEGVLSASFVPVYARLRAEKREAEAAALARAVFAALAAICSIVVLVGIATTPWLVATVAGGFSPEKQRATARLVSIFFPGMGVLVLSALCLGILNAHRRFFVGYAAPIAWNAAIIGALVFAGSTADQDRAAWLVAVGSVIGAVLQLVVQLPSLIAVLPRGGSAGMPPEARTVARNFFPVMLGRGVVQISAYFDQAIASWIATAGAAGVLFYAQNIALLPVSVFGMSISVSELTEMAGQEEATLAEGIRARLLPALRSIAFYVIPCAVAFAALGDVAASTLLETGNFGKHDSTWVWAVLAGSSIGLLAGTMGRVYNSAWYALHDTRTPMKFAVIRILLAAALGSFSALVLPGLLGFDPKWGVAGITASAGIAAWVEFTLLRRSLRARIGDVGLPAGLLPRLWGAACLAAALGFGAKLLLINLHPAARGVAVFALFGVTYLASTSLLGIAEAATLIARVRGRLGGGR
jgi:putative peptidoglycan lipid II flippase